MILITYHHHLKKNMKNTKYIQYTISILIVIALIIMLHDEQVDGTLFCYSLRPRYSKSELDETYA